MHEIDVAKIIHFVGAQKPWHYLSDHPMKWLYWEYLREQVWGRPALMTAAITDPVSYVRMVASLMPREIEATITPVTERMSDAQLEAIIARGIEGGLDQRFEYMTAIGMP